MENKKYVFSDADANDQKAFSEGLEKLLTELSLGINLVINKIPVTLKSESGNPVNGFMDSPSIVLQKKIEQVEAEKTSETAEPTISPFVPQASTDENNTDTKN